MSMLETDFDDDRPWDESATFDDDSPEWGELKPVDQELLEDLPEWDDIVPDLEVEYGDLYRGPFGSIGRDADAGYYVDADGDTSVLL